VSPKLALLLEARRRHGTLLRCGGRFSLWDCFIEQQGRLELWYKDATGSTRMVWAALDSTSLAAPLFS